ncbi:pseudouridine synthase [Lentisalinibacter sediminis]|uniref:pseudouridine synthase n=1 Tax=Lentisalinibacter sediminis TaxID=2992237 RepID=UPI0038687BC4
MRLVLLNKPYRVLSAFTDSRGRDTLAACVDIPEVYPAGRLDYDSEGLLALTDDGRLQAAIADPRHKLPKTYYAQIEGLVAAEALARLRGGVDIRGRTARAVDATAIDEPEWLWPRDPPIRHRQSVPDSWLRITIDEGRNRQVRRMGAAVGLPVLRLIRTRIGPWDVHRLQPGEYREIPTREAWHTLRNFQR